MIQPIRQKRKPEPNIFAAMTEQALLQKRLFGHCRVSGSEYRFRYAMGETPRCFLNAREKACESSKPSDSAISDTGESVAESISAAFSSFRFCKYCFGGMWYAS